MMRMYQIIFSTVLFMPLLSGCSDIKAAKPAAETAVANFHEQYNSELFDAIYNDSHNDFKQSSDYESFNEFIHAVYSKLGKVLSTENKGWNVKNLNLKTFVVLQQETMFEEGAGIETFRYRIKDNQAALIGYNINSRDLIIN